MAKDLKEVRLNLYLKDEALRRQLEDAAARSERSMHREIVYRLRQSLARPADEASAS